VNAGRSGASAVAALIVLIVAHPARAQTQGRLEMALVLSITSPPLYEADGTPSKTAAARLTALGDALGDLADPQLANVPLALAPSPVFCDELQRFAGSAAARVRMSIRGLAADMPVLSAPYADVRLPHLADERAVRYQIAEGRRTLKVCTGAEPAGLLATPDFVLDERVLEALAKTSVTAALASEDRVARAPARPNGVTLVPATAAGATDAPNDVLYRLRHHRAAAAVVHTDAVTVTLINALANDPRVSLATVDELVQDPQVRSVFLPSVARPPASYRGRLERAALAVAVLRSYTTPRNRLVAILRTAYARAVSSAEWDESWAVGRKRAEEIVRAVDEQRRLVRIQDASVTFTSRRGSVPVTVRNRASYPVKIRIALASPKLAFPDGPTRVVTVAPPGGTIVFVALARSTGSFPVEVRLTNPSGAISFDTGELAVRSVAANVSALVLTGGGAAFLLVWYLLTVRRRHRRSEGSAG
jgi:hypothetical protein